jgi:hypothetical protein
MNVFNIRTKIAKLGLATTLLFVVASTSQVAFGMQQGPTKPDWQKAWQAWKQDKFSSDANFGPLVTNGMENAIHMTDIGGDKQISVWRILPINGYVIVPLVNNGDLKLQLWKGAKVFNTLKLENILEEYICKDSKRPTSVGGKHIDSTPDDGVSPADEHAYMNNKTDTCLLISSIARAALLEIDQQIRRICGNDSRLAGLTGASLAASRIISDACRTAKDLNTCNRSLKDAASGNKILYANKAAWMAADGADFLEKGYLLLFGGNQNVKQINKNKKAQYFDDEEEDDDTDDDDLDRGMTKHKDGDVEKTNKLSSALSALTPTLEALLILYMTGLQEKNGYATSIPVPNIITRNLEYLLYALRASEMSFTSDSGSYKKKLACLLGCMAIAGAIFREFKGKSTKRTMIDGNICTVPNDQ